MFRERTNRSENELSQDRLPRHMRRGLGLLPGGVLLGASVVALILAFAFPPSVPECECTKTANGTLSCPPCPALHVILNPSLLLFVVVFGVSGMVWILIISLLPETRPE